MGRYIICAPLPSLLTPNSSLLTFDIVINEDEYNVLCLRQILSRFSYRHL